MAKVKFYQVEKEINGVKYVAQFNGLSAWLRCVDQSYCDDSSNTSTEKLAANVLSMGLIEPKVTVDDFESQDELTEVTSFVQNVMKGNFRAKSEKKPTEEQGK